MIPAVVVDVGNSFIKWGRCAGRLVSEKVSLPYDEPEAWSRQLEAWQLETPAAWAVSGVQPQRCEDLVKWLRRRGNDVLVLDQAQKLPLRILLEFPDKVGIDRLLDAVAANACRRDGVCAVVIDAGSAVTVDWLDHSGAFDGGAIFPGLRLMAQALHDYTALLPLIQVNDVLPLPGRSTIAAMHAGIFWSVAGGIQALVEELATRAEDVDIFLTGGDAVLLAPTLERTLTTSRRRVLPMPNLTLEGLRLAAESQP